MPDAWKDALEGDEIEILPLVNDIQRRYPSGWCTYAYEHEQAPELEVICGGVNTKTPRAAAIWRQGNLLHFGFEQSPAEMNANGGALLVNSIAYISRFTEDRPILWTPSPFAADGKRIFDRDAIGRVIRNPARDLKFLEYILAPDTAAAVKDKTRGELAAWYDQVRGSIHADERGKLTVDDEARRFGTSPAAPEFFDAAVAALGREEPEAAVARRLLGRYAPDGPASDASAAEWKAWWTENRDYLFFSDTGGYRWYVDPLARKRGVPTAELRGADRASQ